MLALQDITQPTAVNLMITLEVMPKKGFKYYKVKEEKKQKQ